MDTVTLLHRSAEDVAPLLLGWTIIAATPQGEIGGIITEVEAYAGQNDPASHAARGLTKRNAPMFSSPGTIYIYRCYGIHLCLNIVTSRRGIPGAVLIRGLMPTRGLAALEQQGKKLHGDEGAVISGPGRVGQALALRLEDSGKLFGEHLQLVPPSEELNPSFVQTSPRIGITRGTDLNWRFFIRVDRLSGHT
jgi:DNA-3-methyladenine glycosylase